MPELHGDFIRRDGTRTDRIFVSDREQRIYGDPDYDGPLLTTDLFGVTLWWNDRDKVLHGIEYPKGGEIFDVRE
jgi:hypothetical protein